MQVFISIQEDHLWTYDNTCLIKNMANHSVIYAVLTSLTLWYHSQGFVVGYRGKGKLRITDWSNCYKGPSCVEHSIAWAAVWSAWQRIRNLSSTWVVFLEPHQLISDRSVDSKVIHHATLVKVMHGKEWRYLLSYWRWNKQLQMGDIDP